MFYYYLFPIMLDVWDILNLIHDYIHYKIQINQLYNENIAHVL